MTPAVMLELRRKDQRRQRGGVGLRLARTGRVRPSEGITLQFGVEKVKITGRNLNAEARPNIRLFAGIVRHRVPWIQEADRPAAMGAGSGDVVIDAIAVA